MRPVTIGVEFPTVVSPFRIFVHGFSLVEEDDFNVVGTVLEYLADDSIDIADLNPVTR